MDADPDPENIDSKLPLVILLVLTGFRGFG
jgi:hypothetical protein